MTVARPPQPTGTDYKSWGNRLNDYLVRTRSQLAYYIAGSSAINDGVLVWDADNSRILVSSNNAWVEVGSGGGGGTITNYLRDDQDDSTAFRLTMGGLTVDTDTLYVDSVNNEVGIGTTNPSEKLEVVGNVEAIEFIGDLRGAVVFKAQAGEALAKGDVVYISGISGNTTVVNKADADDATKMQGFGLAATSASINTSLEIYTFGTLHGLDTSSYALGAELYVSTTAGQLTDTPPTGESAALQKIAKVTRAHATSGSLKIMGAGRTNATPNLNDGNIFIGDSNNQAVTASLATQVSTLETSHDDVLVDGDFTSNGFMKRTGAGTYAIDSNTYLTSEANDLSTTVTWANVPDANITETSVTQHQTALSITENQISDLGTYLTASDITGKADLTGATFTGTITAPNVDISTTGTVTTNIATGNNATSPSATKTVNIGTGFSGFWAGLTTVNIGTQSTSNQNTVNIGSGVSTVNKEDTINLKGNVTVDGTLAGLSYNHVIPLFQGYTNLGSSPAQIGDDFYLRNYNNKHYKRFVEVNAAIGYSGTTSTNDLNVRAIMIVPTSSGNAVDIGSVVSITSSGIYNRDIVIAGDVTHWFSDYAGVGANSNGATPFTSVVSSVYNPTTDQTTFNVGVYNATIPSAGDSIYVHPFDWENAGSELYGHTKQFDVDAEASMNYTIYTKIYFGNIDRIATCRLKFYETATSDSVNIQRLQVYQIDESV